MSWWDTFTGNNQPAYQNYQDQLNQAGQQYQPWIDRGNQAGQQAYGQYDRLVNDPNSVQDQIAGGFYMSPYQQQLMADTTKRMNMNAANTGMIGSGAANAALQDRLSNMSGEFENEYINRGMGSYGMGLGGLGDMSKMGLGALGEKTGLQEQGAAAGLQGDISQNESQAGFWGNLLGGIGGLGMQYATGGLFGGRQGAMNGRQGMPGQPQRGYSNPNSSTFNWG